MDKKYAEKLLLETRKNYNLIAEHFSRTRVTVPEDVKIPTEYTKQGEKVLDLGCGNGALWQILKDRGVEYIGVDNSKELIEIAEKLYLHPHTKQGQVAEGDQDNEVSPCYGVGARPKFQQADALNLPFPENSFDTVYCIGVFHHIPSKEIQLRFLKEAKRVLKSNGRLILRVWNFWQRKKGLKLLLKYSLLKIIGKSQMDFKDIFFPWKNEAGKIVIQRYFHCFTKREMNKLFKKAGFKVEKSWIAGEGKLSNIYIVGQK
jgi:ubiquinone/menaquinone biosynthesis C-methylase UbiE